MAERTIFLKKRPIRKEGIAGGTIVPGMLVKLNSAGNFVAHPTAKVAAGRLFAFENELTNWNGSTSGSPFSDHNVDTPYASGDNLYYGVCSSGAEVYALVAASAAAIVKGDLLESAGDGTLRKLSAGTPGTSYDGVAIAIAQEAVDNSGNASSRARIIVEVI